MKSSHASTTKGRVGVIGLGIMGSAIAANLVKAGFEVIGTDVMEERCEDLINVGGIAVKNSSEVGGICNFVILCLPSVDALESVVSDLARSCEQGSIIIETGTFSLEVKQKAHTVLAQSGIILLDCPLLGNGAQARKGDLGVYASGSAEAILKVSPIFKGFSNVCYDLGQFGNGTRMKLVANMLVTVHNVAAAEAILLGERLGLNPLDLINVVGDGAAGSGMLKLRGPVMVNRTWGEAWMKHSIWQKDLMAISESLREAESPAPLFSASLPIYLSAVASGHANHDTASVYEVLERMTKVESTVSEY